MASQNKYELYYFNVAGLSRTIRILLETVNADYTLKHPQSWESEKPDTIFGRLPILYVTKPDGKRVEIAESNAISRYLAREHGLLGDDSDETAFVESVIDSLNDLLATALHHVFFAKEEEKKAAGKKTLQESAEKLIPYHERLLKKNSSNGHYLKDKFTVADIHAFAILGLLQNVLGEEVFQTIVNSEKTPALVKLNEAVKSTKAVQRLTEQNFFSS
ncbi:uncharacterized protein VTP21DRAFT_9516 [Calcarisporiella thermophila]|uniref:uncharacterized protein n=1 Tax=Calcarisporiella thermophila TaxID=911321 RepID=UPI003743829E